MLNKNEISSLYRTFSPTFNAYTRDGDGRDGYIGYNNGGFWYPLVPHLNLHTLRLLAID